MKYSVTLFLLFCSLFRPVLAQFNYINPVPGSAHQNPETNIILKNGNFIDKSSIAEGEFIEIKGSVSGNHSWVARLSDDNKSIIIQPDKIFAYAETVSVTVHSDLRKTNGDIINGTSFSFTVRKEFTPEQKQLIRQMQLQNFMESNGYDPQKNNAEQITYPLDSMPTYVINVN